MDQVGSSPGSCRALLLKYVFARGVNVFLRPRKRGQRVPVQVKNLKLGTLWERLSEPARTDLHHRMCDCAFVRAGSQSR